MTEDAREQAFETWGGRLHGRSTPLRKRAFDAGWDAAMQARPDLEGQIERLAKFIMDEVPGEPSESGSAVDTAIRWMRTAMQARPEYTDEDVERVAAVIASADPVWRATYETWETLLDEDRDRYREMARFALNALKEGKP